MAEIPKRATQSEERRSNTAQQAVVEARAEMCFKFRGAGSQPFSGLCETDDTVML